MHMADDLNIAGRLTLRKMTGDGQVVEARSAPNAITLAGRDLIARLFNWEKAGDQIERVTEMRVGSDEGAFNAQAAALGSQVGDAVDIAAVEEEEVVDASGAPRKRLRLVAELTEADCNGELREAGLFTADGVMYNRVTFDVITKSDQFRLALVWEITF